MLCSMLVDVGLSVVTLLLDLVFHGITSSSETSRCAHIGVFGDLLVGLFACGVGTALGLVGKPVAG